VLKQGIDTATMVGRCTFHVLAAMDEMVADLISGGTREGLASARARGRVGGRKPKLSASELSGIGGVADVVDDGVPGAGGYACIAAFPARVLTNQVVRDGVPGEAAHAGSGGAEGDRAARHVNSVCGEILETILRLRPLNTMPDQRRPKP